MISAASNPILNLILNFGYQYNGWFGSVVAFIVTAILCVYLFFGCIFKVFATNHTKKLRPFGVATIVCLVLISVYDKSSIYRYICYPLTIYITLVLPLLFRRTSRLVTSPTKSLGIYAGLVFFYILLISKPTPEASGYDRELSKPMEELVAYISTLPKDIMLAGWPNYLRERPIENIPFHAHRSVIFADAYNLAQHRDYTISMMGRFDAVIDAYLATDILPIIKLRDKYDVDYMIVEPNDFAETSAPVTLYKNKDKEIKDIWDNTKKEDFILPKLLKTAAIFSNEELVLLDLHRIPLTSKISDAH